jgi:transposase
VGTAIAIRTAYSSKELRRLASRVKNAGQARRLLAIAAVLDGASRGEAAMVGGMDRQTLRDWVIRARRRLVDQPRRSRPIEPAGQAEQEAQGVSRPLNRQQRRGPGCSPPLPGIAFESV